MTIRMGSVEDTAAFEAESSINTNTIVFEFVTMTMPRGSVEDTAAYAATNSTGYAESVLGAGIGSNGKVPSLSLSLSSLSFSLSSQSSS